MSCGSKSDSKIALSIPNLSEEVSKIHQKQCFHKLPKKFEISTNSEVVYTEPNFEDKENLIEQFYNISHDSAQYKRANQQTKRKEIEDESWINIEEDVESHNIWLSNKNSKAIPSNRYLKLDKEQTVLRNQKSEGWILKPYDLSKALRELNRNSFVKSSVAVKSPEVPVETIWTPDLLRKSCKKKSRKRKELKSNPTFEYMRPNTHRLGYKYEAMAEYNKLKTNRKKNVSKSSRNSDVYSSKGKTRKSRQPSRSAHK